MFIATISCLLLIALTTVVHYETLRGLTEVLPRLAIPNRTRLLVVIFTAITAHVIEIGLYGAALYMLVEHMGLGSLSGTTAFSFLNCLYFSAETYTSLGFGDLMPVGPVRLLAGIEALNGLLLIGWSASYIYIAMERFWNVGRRDHR